MRVTSVGVCVGVRGEAGGQEAGLRRGPTLGPRGSFTLDVPARVTSEGGVAAGGEASGARRGVDPN